MNVLQCWSHYVSINSSVSSTKSIKSGVIQGSVIGLFLFSLFTEDLCQVVLWSKQNGLPLNIVKCQVLHYNRRITQNPCHEYYIKGEKLNSVTECINLGIACTTECRFRQHISNIWANASRRIGLVLRVFQCRQPEFMLQLFKSYVHPILEYGV